MKNTLFGAAAFVFLSLSVAQADSLVVARPSGTDSVNWSQLGPNNTVIPNAFLFTTADGVSGTGTFGGTSNGQVTVQDFSIWDGNFAPGDVLNWTKGNAPLTLNFGTDYTQIGAQIQANYFGAFTAQICDNNGFCFTEVGNSTPGGDNSAIYIGIAGSGINSLSFSITNCAYACSDFAINDVTLNGPATTTPEPSSFLLLGSGLWAIAKTVRRRFQG